MLDSRANAVRGTFPYFLLVSIIIFIFVHFPKDFDRSEFNSRHGVLIDLETTEIFGTHRWFSNVIFMISVAGTININQINFIIQYICYLISPDIKSMLPIFWIHFRAKTDNQTEPKKTGISV